MKSFLLLAIFILLTSCGDIPADDSFRGRNPICGDSQTACIKMIDWEIDTNLDKDNFPEKISLSLNKQVFLNECNNRSSAFKVDRSLRDVLIEANNFSVPSERYLELEIKNCENAATFYFNSKQTYISNGSRLLIELNN